MLHAKGLPACLLDADSNQLLAVRIDDMNGAGNAGVETVNRAQDFERLLRIVQDVTLERTSYAPSVPAASRGPAFHVVGTTA